MVIPLFILKERSSVNRVLSFEMGIAKLNDLLKRKCPDVINDQPLSRWRGSRIAIDLSNLMFIYMSPVWKDVVNSTNVAIEEPSIDKAIISFLERFQAFITRFLRHQITPIIVCDGKPPVEKDAVARADRIEKYRLNKEKLDNLKQSMEGQDPLDIDIADIEKLRVCYRASVPIGRDVIETIKTILAGVGIPVLQAIGEAEALCSLLCRTGRAMGVYSNDTDNLVHGCCVVLTKSVGRKMNPKTNKMDDYVSTTNLYDILNGLDLKYKEFVDMCIMSKCDYNRNMPGIAVGKSYDLIKRYSSIDNLPSTYDTTCLNHVVCRRLFSHLSFQDSCENYEDSLNVDVNSLSTRARDILTPFKIDYWIADLIDLYRDFPQPSHEVLMSPIEPPVNINIIGEEDNNDNGDGDNNSAIIIIS